LLGIAGYSGIGCLVNDASLHIGHTFAEVNNCAPDFLSKEEVEYL
jgi:hypothetical protein